MKAFASGMPKMSSANLQKGRSMASGLGGRARSMGSQKFGAARAAGVKAGLSAAPLLRQGTASARAVGNKVMTSERAARIKAKWGAWLAYRPPNLVLLFTNVLYLGITLAVLGLGLTILGEHADDFTLNSFEQFVGKEEPRPCGMPTPDGMKMLEALGTVGGGGWSSVTLEPDYQEWMLTIDRAICSKFVPGINIDVDNWAGYLQDTTGDDGDASPHVHELLALSYLMKDPTLRPTKTEVLAGTLAPKAALFEKRTCLREKSDDEIEPFYSGQQMESYGDLKVRVARAYVAAMPAFVRYHVEKAECSEADNRKSPFDKFCRHAAFIKTELDNAVKDADMMVLGSKMKTSDPASTDTSGTTFIQMVYRLLALSLAGYHDRHINDGNCFKNSVGNTAVDFCYEAFTNTPALRDDPLIGIGPITGQIGTPMLAYSEQQTLITKTSTCTHQTAPPPPPPTPPFYRLSTEEMKVGIGATGVTDLGTVPEPWVQVCAETLQYGLFEQGRLFGIPDITGQFVIDNRVDRFLHFIARWIYNGMYIDPWKSAGDVMADPKARLEAYMAYRLASTTVWGMMIANVCGFMFARAIVPLIVYCLRFIKVKTVSGEEIVMMRPQADIPVYITVGVTAFLVYWLIWVDPATQSHYPVTTACDEWYGLGVLVPHGAYVTTWGKRRFDRLGEYVIGYLLLIMLLVFAFQQFAGRNFVSKARRARNAVKGPLTSRSIIFFWVLFVIALGVETCFAVQAGLTGEDWHAAAEANDQTATLAKTLVKDCTMAVWSAFWIGLAIGVYRQRWAVDSLDKKWKLLWFGSTVFCFLVPLLQSNVYLADEIAIAFKDNRGTADRRRNEIYWSTLLFTGLLGVPLALAFMKLKATFAQTVSTAATVDGINDIKNTLNNEINSALATTTLSAADRALKSLGVAAAPEFSFSVSGAFLKSSIAKNTRSATGSTYATGTTGKGVQYLPLLPMV